MEGGERKVAKKMVFSLNVVVCFVECLLGSLKSYVGLCLITIINLIFKLVKN